jgi:hypothetical protein
MGRVAALVVLLALVLWARPPGAHAAVPVRARANAGLNVTNASAGTEGSRRKAPAKPPLASTPVATGRAEEEPAASSDVGDPLVSNGLDSPLCRAGAGEGELSPQSESDCRTSGFEAAPAPTGNYAFDVHINTGVTKVRASLEADFQDLLQLWWTVLVALLHGLVVMLEWCYTIDLLRGGAMSGVARALRTMQATVTRPWLALVLAIAAVLALYHGLVRRRVAETVGQAAMTLAMMAGGLWVIVNPTGTVGALGELSSQAGLGTLGAVAAGAPGHPDRTLADSMRLLFSGAIEGPWCFMEFGSVGWCANPADLDHRLHAAGLRIAATEQARIGCRTGAEAIEIGGGPGPCVPPDSAQARALSYSAELLRGAHTNRELFLALPANGPERNSINDSGTLFNVLCGGDEEPCKGPTAAQAEFRTQGGTSWRCMGLFFIWLGLLGAILTLGFIALHLLGAAIATLLYLLLAPAAVLAPALGDGGRAAFRGWLTRLLGAVVSKLVFSFLLGVMLLMERVLTLDLTALGWFTQWLLVSTMWWGAFLQRRQVLGFLQGARGHGGHEQRSLARRVSGALETPRAVLRRGGWVKDKLSRQAPSVEERHQREQAGHERAKAGMDEQVRRMLEHEHRDASAAAEADPEARSRISAKRAQLERVRVAHEAAREQARQARGAGERASTVDELRSSQERGLEGASFGAEERSHQQHAARLKARMERLEGEISSGEGSLATARQMVDGGKKAKRGTGNVFTREQAERRGRFLDAQAALPASGVRAGPGGGERRDYGAMAGLAGYGRSEYDQLDASSQRAARLEIDRELALRQELNTTAIGLAASGGGSLGRRQQRKTDRDFDRTLEQGMRDAGHRLPSSRSQHSNLDSWLQESRRMRSSGGALARVGEEESSVMRDAREVAARRKRQLGRDRR